MTGQARRWHTLAYGTCGCEHPRRHEPGCLFGLGPDRRVLLAAATIVDPLPAPRLSPDDECQLLAQIRADRDYARKVAAWLIRRAA